jgi:hypothetical protein
MKIIYIVARKVTVIFSFKFFYGKFMKKSIGSHETVIEIWIPSGLKTIKTNEHFPQWVWNFLPKKIFKFNR